MRNSSLHKRCGEEYNKLRSWEEKAKSCERKAENGTSRTEGGRSTKIHGRTAAMRRINRTVERVCAQKGASNNGAVHTRSPSGVVRPESARMKDTGAAEGGDP